jgi:hypothetical protein
MLELRSRQLYWVQVLGNPPGMVGVVHQHLGLDGASWMHLAAWVRDHRYLLPEELDVGESGMALLILWEVDHGFPFHSSGGAGNSQLLVGFSKLLQRRVTADADLSQWLCWVDSSSLWPLACFPRTIADGPCVWRGHSHVRPRVGMRSLWPAGGPFFKPRQVFWVWLPPQLWGQRQCLLVLHRRSPSRSDGG